MVAQTDSRPVGGKSKYHTQLALMETRIAELRYKEVISVEDGTRYGYVGDMEVDLETGQVRALVVPGRRRFFGLLGREEDKVIPWTAVKRFGEDIILVER